MPRVQEVEEAVGLAARWELLRRWMADRWTALLGQRWLRARDPQKHAALRLQYIECIRCWIKQEGCNEQIVALDRLETLDEVELLALYLDCRRIAEQREGPLAAPPAGEPSSPSRDALWDLTPLLK